MTWGHATLRRIEDGEKLTDDCGRCACDGPKGKRHAWTFLAEVVNDRGDVRRSALCCARAAAFAAKFQLPFPLTSATAPEAA